MPNDPLMQSIADLSAAKAKPNAARRARARIALRDANKFLCKYWPEIGPINPNPTN